MAADLPTVNNVVPQVQAPQSRVSPGQIASPYLEFANNLEKGAQATGDIAKLLAHEEGLKAVTRDENGNVQVERPVIVGDAALAYKHAMQTAAVVQGEDVIRTDMLEMRHKYQDDPAGFAKAAETYKQTKVPQYAKAAGPDVGLALERITNSTAREYHEGILNQKERRDLSRATASIETQIGATENELYALTAGGADMKSPEVRGRLEKIGALWGQLVSNPRIGIPKEKMDYALSQLTSQLYVAGADRRIAEIQKDQGVEAAAAEVEKIRTDPKLNLTPGQRTAYASQLEGAIRQRVNGQTQIDKNAVTAIRAAQGIVEQGFPVPPAQMATVEQAAIQSGNPGVVQELQNLKTIQPVLQDWRKASPAQLERNIADVERTMAEHGATPALLTLRDAGTKLLANARAGIKADPNGWADRTGAVPMAPIDWGGQGQTHENLTTQMRQRVASAETVASVYGIQPSYLTPAERQAIGKVAAMGGKEMTDTAAAIVAGFGDRAPAVLAELGKGDPVLAHVGGLLNTGGSSAVASDAADSIALRNNPEALKNAPHWFRTPNDKTFNWQADIQRGTYGGAFAQAGETGSAAEQTAKAAFLSRAMRQHFDPTVDSPDSAKAKTTYDRALQEAAGAVFDPSGNQYGGVGKYRTGSAFWGDTRKVLVPSAIRADRFGDVVGAIRDEDLGGKWQAGGRTYSAADLRNATPVAVKGGYWFALGDPQSDSPKWIPDANGRKLTVDIDRLEPALRRRVPQAYASQ